MHVIGPQCCWGSRQLWSHIMWRSDHSSYSSWRSEGSVFSTKGNSVTSSKIIPTNKRVCRMVGKSRTSVIWFLWQIMFFFHPLFLELLLTMWAHASTHTDPRWKLGRSSRTGASEPTIISDRSVWIWRRHTLVLDVFSRARLKHIWRMGGPCDLKKFTEWVHDKPMMVNRGGLGW